MLPLFRYPKSGKIDFKKHLNLERQDVGVVDQVTAARKKLFEMCSKTPNAYALGSLINAADLYLPHIIALANWAESHKEIASTTNDKEEKKEVTGVFKSDIEFEWKSCYSDKSTTYYAPNDFQFEIGMILAAKAGFLWERARSLLSTLSVALKSGGSSTHLSDCSSAAMNLREAAGIWKYIESSVIPKIGIATGSSKVNIPPELSPIFCQGMELLCLGSGQLLAYVGSYAKMAPPPPIGPDGKPGQVDPDAPRSSHSPPSLCASIIMDYCEKIKTALFSLDAQKDVRKLLPSCFGDAGKENGLVHRVIIPLCTSLAHLCIAQSLWDQKRYGEAVASTRAAQELMTKIDEKNHKMGEDFEVLYSFAKEDLEKKLKEYQHENSFLYRQPVPSEASTPDPRSICKVSEFTLPEPAWTDLPSKK